MELVQEVVRHQGGVLPRVLTCDDRLRAHDTLRELTNTNGPHGRATSEKDLALLEWVRRDPSLFVERIPAKNPHSLFARAWDSQRSWWGTWAYRAASAGFIESTKALFELGVHPDDGKVFSVRPMWMEAWASKPQRLAILFAHGANPDVLQSLERKGGFRANPHSSPFRRSIEVMRGNAVSLSFAKESEQREERLRAIRQALECANLMLRAGAKQVDPGPEDFLDDKGAVVAAAASQATAVGALTKVLGFLKDCPEERELTNQLLRDVCAVGADVNRMGGDSRLAPVVMAIRANDIETFRLLVELGADTRDSTLVRAEKVSPFQSDSAVDPLADEAHQVGGHLLQSQVTESLMVHAIRLAKQDAAAAPVARRQARAL